MKKLTLILFLLFGKTFFIFPASAKDLYLPPDGNWNWRYSSCADAGYKENGRDSLMNRDYCIDRNCVAAPLNSVTCTKCTSDFYVSGNICQICPQGATCDGYIFMCPDGRFNNGTQCAKCHLSCKTCSGEKENNCTSCDSRAYLSGNTCIDCPPNAVCDGSAYFSCNTGYSKSDGNCVADQQEPAKTNTVNSCPSRMKLSADGCCCINK